MPEIYPKVTRAKLKKGARKTSEGKGRAPLPGVKTDAKHVNATDKCGYQANRDLAALNLDWTEVRAPSAGLLSRRMVDPGNMIKADELAEMLQGVITHD